MWNISKIFKTILIHYSDTGSKRHLKGRKKLTTFVAEKMHIRNIGILLVKGSWALCCRHAGTPDNREQCGRTALINLTAAAYAGPFYFSNHIYYLLDIYKPLVRKTKQVLFHFACEKTKIQKVR